MHRLVLVLCYTNASNACSLVNTCNAHRLLLVLCYTNASNACSLLDTCNMHRLLLSLCIHLHIFTTPMQIIMYSFICVLNVFFFFCLCFPSSFLLEILIHA